MEGSIYYVARKIAFLDQKERYKYVGLNILIEDESAKLEIITKQLLKL